MKGWGVWEEGGGRGADGRDGDAVVRGKKKEYLMVLLGLTARPFVDKGHVLWTFRLSHYDRQTNLHTILETIHASNLAVTAVSTAFLDSAVVKGLHSRPFCKTCL